jgi:response regulator of citrate/malate metabolism
MLVRRPKVLVVDDEDNIVLALHRVLYQDNDRYDVLLARSAEIAEQILENNRIDVLVTDVHLPEKSGMDLLSWVAVQAPSTRVIIMTAFDVGGIKDRAHAYGCLRLMRKPFDVHEMRAAILRALTLRDSFTGSLSELSCVDVIQMLCIARKSSALRLSEGESAGVVHIEQGEPVHAVWDDLVGEEAFFRILGVKNGLFCTTPLPPDVERSLRGDWQYLMIEGMRRLDEANAGKADLPEGDRPSLRISFGSIPPPPRISAPEPESAKLRVPPPARLGSEPPQAPRESAPASQARPPPSSGSSVTLSRSTVGSMLRGPSPGEERAIPVPRPEVTRLIDDGFSALRAGRRDEARRAWEEALRLDPDNRQIEVNLRKLGGGAPASGTVGGRLPSDTPRETG